MSNPFIEKANRKEQGKKIALQISQRNYNELTKLLARFTDDDDVDTRERIRKRVQEAKIALDEMEGL